jgi:hypothetical protein
VFSGDRARFLTVTAFVAIELIFTFYISDPKDDGVVKLPQKIALELRPRTNDSWAYVQSLAQNPRVKMTLRLDRRLSNVIEYLEKKWKPHRFKIVSFQT